jgi:hypothetical protein
VNLRCTTTTVSKFLPDLGIVNFESRENLSGDNDLIRLPFDNSQGRWVPQALIQPGQPFLLGGDRSLPSKAGQVGSSTFGQPFLEILLLDRMWRNSMTVNRWGRFANKEFYVSNPQFVNALARCFRSGEPSKHVKQGSLWFAVIETGDQHQPQRVACGRPLRE